MSLRTTHASMGPSNLRLAVHKSRQTLKSKHFRNLPIGYSQSPGRSPNSFSSNIPAPIHRDGSKLGPSYMRSSTPPYLLSNSPPDPHSFGPSFTELTRSDSSIALKTRSFTPKSSRLLYSSNEKEPDSQERLTNLGSITDQLKARVPAMLQTSLPKEILSPDVLLRICPSHFESVNAYLPNIKGRVSYYATCKAAQIFLTSFVINPRSQLHIESIRVSHFPDAKCLIPQSTKIFVRWSTCSEGCTHLVDKLGNPETSSTTSAKLGSHKWSKIDPGSFIDQQKSVSGSLADAGKSIIGLKKEETGLERIISGLFIFELNETNDQILVHTIEDMNILERRDEQPVESKLRVC